MSCFNFECKDEACTVGIKNDASEWFDGEIAEKIHKRNRLHKKFKSTKLHVGEEIYKEVRTTFPNLIRKKKKAYFEEKLKESTANPQKLWKTLKQLVLPEKRPLCTDVCLKAEEVLKFDPFQSLYYLKNSIPISQMIHSKSSCGS